MAKLKTHKSAEKRFKVSKSGKLLHATPGYNHLKSKKAARIKYRVRQDRSLSEKAAKNIKKVLSN